MSYGGLAENTAFTPITPEDSPEPHRGKAGNTAATPYTTTSTLQTITDVSVTYKDTTGNTVAIPITLEKPTSAYRDIAENTAPTPVDHAGAYQGENTPRGPCTSSDTHMGSMEKLTASNIDPEAITSPATSTPGSTPINPKKGKLRSSELQESDKSFIGSSLIEENKKIGGDSKY